MRLARLRVVAALVAPAVIAAVSPAEAASGGDPPATGTVEAPANTPADAKAEAGPEAGWLDSRAGPEAGLPDSKACPEAGTPKATGKPRAPAGKPRIGATPALRPFGSGGSPPPDEDRNLFERYVDIFDREMDYIGRSDFWGAATSRLPKGYLSVKYRFNAVGAAGWFDRRGTRVGGPVDPVVADFGDAGSIRVDYRPDGWVRIHELDLTYGILGTLDVFVRLPLLEMETSIEPLVEVRGEGVRQAFGVTADEVFASLERLGRPRPRSSFSTRGPEVGDLVMGVSWNPHRTKYFSIGLTGRITAPTGRTADPDGRLDLGLGAEIDRGSGSFALGASVGFDVRPPGFADFLTFSFLLDLDQPLPQERLLPRFGKRDEAFRASLASLGPAAEAVVDERFPDLSSYAGRTITVWPGTSLGVMAGMGADLYVLGLSVAYRYDARMPAVLRGVPPEVSAAIGEPSGAAAATRHHLVAGIGTGALMGLYLPVVVEAAYDWTFAGVSTFRREPDWSFAVSLFLPLNTPSRAR